MKFSRVHHIAIICSNYPISKRFYTEVLGLEIIRESYRKDRDSYKLDLAVNGFYQIELFSFPNPPIRPSFPEAVGLRHLAFEVADLQESVKELEDKGVSLEGIRLDDITGKRYTFFSDPDGLPLELYER